jgi:hypothetical protein|tara:strand:+ start:150 stop:341 length:192 start_codon:yes stop_codon:yes gene_type:complete
MRFAGVDLGYDFGKDMDNNLRHLIRKERSGFDFDDSFYSMSPENSEPEFSMSGSYQPEVAYGR